jgi:lysophospholipase
MTYDLLPHKYFSPQQGVQLRYAVLEPLTEVKGTVFVIPGRREFLEKKYSEISENLFARGLRLVMFEPRNQGLSTHTLSGRERQRDHIEDFSIYLNDLRAFFKELVTPYKSHPTYVHAHSLGGHVALRWLSEDQPSQITGAFITAPMLDLADFHPHLVQTMGWVMAHTGHATDYPPKVGYDYGQLDTTFHDNFLTNDPERFKIIQNYFNAYPDMVVGGVTWTWLLAAVKSLHTLQDRTYLSRINIPVLTLIGDQDRITPLDLNTVQIIKIPRAQIHVLKGARHDVLNETDAIQRPAWSQINLFLDGLHL